MNSNNGKTDNSKTANVFFLSWDDRKRLPDLLDKSEAADVIQKGDLVAIKMHFGESGGDGFIKPEWTRPILAMVRKAKGNAFLTDTNTIYHGMRSNAVDHLKIATNHGFTQSKLQTPIIISDGLRGNDYVDIEVGGTHFEKVKIATGIEQANSMITLSHFKGHVLAGFGGAVKNLGMGCGAKIGKFEMHSNASPDLDVTKCTGCGACVKVCAHGALEVIEKKIKMDKSKCAGCGDCIVACHFKAFSVAWDSNTAMVQERLAEYAAGALKGKRAFHINFANHITENCDCMGIKEEPLVPDIGIFASTDPVALDQACLDMLQDRHGDALKKLHSNIDETIQLVHAEKMGIGTRQYNLITV
jgi:uncharacterized protein